MYSSRFSPAAKPNTGIQPVATRALGGGNKAWIKQARAEKGIILLGGARVPHFRLRVAQSYARADLAPSFWSMSGIAMDERRFLSIPIDSIRPDPSVPEANAIQVCSWSDYDDPALFPNVAVIDFGADQRKVMEAVNGLERQRTMQQYPRMLWDWLGYAWGVPDRDNPLQDGRPFACTAFVAAVHARVGIDITPGLASNSVCPEALWTSVRWWNEYFATQQIDVKGSYLVRQPSAAAVGARDQVVDGTIRPNESKQRRSLLR